jgi:hypothetical protein
MIRRIKEINWRENLKNIINIKLELIIFYANSWYLGINWRKEKIRKIIIET